MTDLLVALVVVGLLVLVGVFVRELRPHTREAAQLDLELDEILEADDEREVAADDAGYTDAMDGESAATGVLAVSDVPASAEALELHVRPGPVISASRLTPAQRRRAVKKGRIPRTASGFPGMAPDRGDASPSNAGNVSADRPLAHLSAATPVNLAGQAEDAGRLPGEYHHPRHERIPRPLTIWDPMMRRPMPIFPTLLESVAYEAHFRRWEAEMAGMINGARQWMETAA